MSKEQAIAETTKLVAEIVSGHSSDLSDEETRMTFEAVLDTITIQTIAAAETALQLVNQAYSAVGHAYACAPRLQEDPELT